MCAGYNIDDAVCVDSTDRVPVDFLEANHVLMVDLRHGVNFTLLTKPQHIGIKMDDEYEQAKWRIAEATAKGGRGEDENAPLA
jgi:hypothetical protein